MKACCPFLVGVLAVALVVNSTLGRRSESSCRRETPPDCNRGALESGKNFLEAALEARAAEDRVATGKGASVLFLFFPLPSSSGDARDLTEWRDSPLTPLPPPEGGSQKNKMVCNVYSPGVNAWASEKTQDRHGGPLIGSASGASEKIHDGCSRPLIASVNLRAATSVATLAEDPVTTEHDGIVELRSPQFVYRLDTAAGLRGESWENRLTGKTVSLGKGPEVELDFDAAEQWIPITGWRTRRLAEPSVRGGRRPGLSRRLVSTAVQRFGVAADFAARLRRP